jgi:hypothetical protein
MLANGLLRCTRAILKENIRALHAIKKDRSDVLVDICGSTDLGLDMPKYKTG